MKRNLKRLLSVALSLAMVFSMTGMNTALAAEEPQGGEITAFAPLGEAVENQSVPQGTEQEGLNLPAKLTVTVERTVTEEPAEPVADEGDSVSGSGSDPDAATPGEPATVTEEISLPVTWDCADYDPATEAGMEFVFAPAWDTDKFPLGEGAQAPEITVTVTKKQETPQPYGLLGVDAPVTDATTLAAALNAIENGCATAYTNTNTVVLAKSCTLTSDLAIPANVMLKIDTGGKLTVSGGTLTISGSSDVRIVNGGEMEVAGGTVSIANTGANSSGVFVDIGSTLTISGGTVRVNNDAGAQAGVLIMAGSALKFSGSGALTGEGVGTVQLINGAKVTGAAGKFSDKGNPLAENGEVTVGSANATPSAAGLTVGTYVWDADNSRFDSGYTPTVFVPVTDITGVPASVAVGTNLPLGGTVAPGNATNKTIVWSLTDAGTTGATLNGATLSTTAAGTVTVKATIVNGLTADSDYTKDFTIAVSDTTSTVATADELKAELVKTTAATISVTEDIGLTLSGSNPVIALGASHTLNIENGKTLTIGDGGSANCAMINLNGNALTVNGGGKLVINNYGSNGIYGSGTLNLENITAEVTNSVLAGLGNIGTLNIGDKAAVTLKGAGADLMKIGQGQTVNVNSGGKLVAERTLSASNNISVDNGALNIENGGTVTVNGSDWGLYIDEGTLNCNGGTLDGSGNILLNETHPVTIKGLDSKFTDRGTKFTASGSVTVGLASAQPSADGLTEGVYTWDASSSTFSKPGYTVSGTVKDGGGNPVAGAAVTLTYYDRLGLLPHEAGTATTDNRGAYTFSSISASYAQVGTGGNNNYLQDYSVKAAKGGSEALSATFSVAGANVTGKELTLGGGPITYAVTVVNGTASPAKAAKGETVTITANAPESGKRFTKWIASDGANLADAASQSTTFTMPEKAVTVTATYENLPPNEYAVTVQNNGHGTANANVSSAASGAQITLTATPEGGYRFKEWQVVSGGVTITDNKFTMPANTVVVKAVFEQIAHTHTPEAAWSSDKDSHWHECTAGDGEKMNKAAHTAGGWITDMEATESKAGSRHKECTVCKYVMETGTIAPIGPEDPTNPEDPTGPENPTNPQTGDSTPILPFALLGLSSLGLGALLIVSKKRKFKVIKK